MTAKPASRRTKMVSRAHSITMLIAAVLLSMTLTSIISPGSGEGLGITTPLKMNTDAVKINKGFFTMNMGQIDNDEILFSGFYPDGVVGFSKDGIVLKVAKSRVTGFLDHRTLTEGRSGTMLSERDNAEDRSGELVKIGFSGSNDIIPIGKDELSMYSNYFLGNDPGKWRTGVPNYREIVYQNVWDGIDIVYIMNDAGLKYDIVLHPGSDHDDVRMKVEGCADTLRTTGNELKIPLMSNEFVMDGELDVFYTDGGNEKLDSSFEVDGDTYRFDLKDRDPDRTVVIDPLLYSTFIGGTGWDEAWDMDVDEKGCMYLARYTESTDFPTTPGVYDTTFNGGAWDIFVSKLSASGDSLEYSTFIGGSGFDTAVAIAVDHLGFAYVGGVTDSSDFPTTPGAFDTTHEGGDNEAFILKLGLNGESLQYATFIGGAKDDAVHRIDTDDEGNAYIAGMTESEDFPATSGSFDISYNGGVADAFAAKLSSGGTSLIYSTFLGGGGDDQPFGLEVDDSGCSYIFGDASSKDFPTTPGAFDTSHNGGEMDLFLTKLDPSGRSLVFSTYIGGGKNEESQDIVLDDEGYAYLTGATYSGSFPLTEGAFDRTQNGNKDAFVTKINVSGDAVIYSTYLGDDLDEVGYGIDVDHEGYAYVVGITGSRNFPVSDFPLYRTSRGGMDTFVTKLNREGTSLRYSTYFGGNGDDIGTGISCDRNSCAIMVGTTTSRNLPVTEGAFEVVYNGGLYDAFASRMNMSTVPTAPRALKAQYGDSLIELQWLEPKDAGGPTKVFYNIYRGLTPLGISYYKTIEETKYTDTGLTNGETYYYRVSAENDMGEGGFSNEANAIPGRLPSAPRNLEILSGNRNVSLSWDVPEDDGGWPIARYHIFRGEDPSLLEETARVEEGEFFRDETVTNGVTYYYQLTAVNKIGQGPPSSIESVMPAYTPSDPRELTAVASNGWVNLSWIVPLYDGGLGIDGYILYKGTGSGELEPLEGLLNVLEYHDQNVKNGITYYYQVRAVNSMGEGRWSEEVFSKPETKPSVPMNFTVTHGDGIVILKWLAPETDGGSAITRYEIHKGKDPDSLSFLARVEEGQRYEDLGVRNGFTYHYKIGAVNRLGYGPWTETLSGTPKMIPMIPSNLEAKLEGKRIELKWRPPYTDGGGAITNYRIYRGPSPDDLKFFVSVGTALNYTDTNITGDGAYYYRVAAVNSEGEGEWSKEAKVIISHWDEPESSAFMDILGYWWIIIIPTFLIILIISGLGILTYRYRETWKEDGRPNFIKMFKQLQIDMKK